MRRQRIPAGDIYNHRIADRSVLNKLPHVLKGGVKASVKANHKLNTGFIYYAEQLIYGFEGSGYRFFTKHMQPSLRGSFNNLFVGIRRSGNYHSVQIAPLYKLSIIIVSINTINTNLTSPLLGDIAHTDQLGLRYSIGNVLRVNLSLTSHSKYAQSNSFH